MSYNGIIPDSAYSKSVNHLASHNLDPLNPLPVKSAGEVESIVIPVPPPAVPIYDTVILPEPKYLKQLVCESLISGSLAKRIELYDTNAPPTGAEPLLFGFILTDNIPTHNFTFPDSGLNFTQGIGLRCIDLGGGGSISDLITTFVVKNP